MMKKLLQLSIIAALLAFTVLAIPTTNTSTAHAASASAHGPKVAAVSCSGPSCDGQSPVSTGCSSTPLVTHQVAFSSNGGGYVEFVFSATCHAAWGFIHFNNAMASGHTGDVGIYRTGTSGGQICETGGNGEVEPGQHSCYSAMLGDGPNDTAQACGWYDLTELPCTNKY
jgi:hypothetical protein